MIGIATNYSDHLFRSRLEARWAAFFDLIQWQWTYEPFDGNGYIPDFVIHGANPLLIEVKPAVTADQYYGPIDKVEAGLHNVWDCDILIVGACPLPTLINNFACNIDTHPSAGVLGEFRDGEWCWDTGVWFDCAKCGQVAIFHQLMSWHGRPCGCYDGDGYLGLADKDLLQWAWSEATNRVQWNRPTTKYSDNQK